MREQAQFWSLIKDVHFSVKNIALCLCFNIFNLEYYIIYIKIKYIVYLKLLKLYFKKLQINELRLQHIKFDKLITSLIFNENN